MSPKVLYLSSNRETFSEYDRHLVSLSEGALQSGYEVVVACVSGSGLERALRASHIGTVPLKLLSPPSSLNEIRMMLRREKPDILHTIGFFINNAGRIAGLLAGVPIIVSTVHSEPDSTTQFREGTVWHFNQKVRNGFDRFTARAAKKIITVSESINKKYVGLGFPPDKLVTIPNSISPEFTDRLAGKGPSFEMPEGTLIGCIGRLEEVKGIRYLIDACRILRDQGVEFRAMIIGEGPLKKDLTDYVKKNRLRDEFIFTGWLDVADSISVLARLDVYVLPSLSEGLNTSLLEALVLERPVVSTDVGGSPEVIKNGETGILVPPKNPQAMAQAITTMLEDRLTGEAMGAAGRKLVLEKYTLDQMIGRTLNLYGELLGADERKSVREGRG